MYHIEKGDIGGAAGTIFFQFVIGQLIYADMYNLKPWVYLNNVSYVIYDPLVHGQGPGVSFDMMSGMNVSYIQRPNGHWRDAYPGPPEHEDALVPTKFHFDGNGVWEDYFEPVSDFVPGDQSCRDKPLLTMDLYLVTPGVHGFAPWAPRCWRYQYLPDYITKPHLPLNEWLEPQRIAAHKTVQKYIRLRPKLLERAENANPSCSLSNPCLGLHIRQSDKAGGRRQIQTSEFLPWVERFLEAGGKWIYVATDSGKVLEEINTKWPTNVQNRIRTIGDNVVRSNDKQAVFDIASHHRTNTEILIEIQALANCQFLVHGLSAVTESSIWMNIDLHYTSVNLEDPDHLPENDFGDLVKQVIQGGNASQVLAEKRRTDWWKGNNDVIPDQQPSQHACDGVEGILHIANAGRVAAAGTAFFTSVLNQIIYAEEHNLKPWVHLNNESSYIFDDVFHSPRGVTLEDMIFNMHIDNTTLASDHSIQIPGKVVPNYQAQIGKLYLPGTGIWDHYLEPVTDFVPGDTSCQNKPLVSLTPEQVDPGLNALSPTSVKAWRYDDVPDIIWKPENISLRDWKEPQRRRANKIINKYYRFRPFIEERVHEVNPITPDSPPCLAVHLRGSDKGGKYRGKFPANRFRDYMAAFVEAGGTTIYVASDSRRMLEYIDQHFSQEVKNAIRTQGPYVARAAKHWPPHSLDSHHRTNSELLVDVLAMSKCQLLLHGNSAASEAAIYLNLNLHNQSMNWEDKEDFMSVEDFRDMSLNVLRAAGVKTPNITREAKPPTEAPKSLDPVEVARQRLRNVSYIADQPQASCRRNAIIYLAQKKHSSYNRDSYGIFLESLELLNKNYLSLNGHKQNTDLIVFHTSDFDTKDLESFEEKFGKDVREIVRFVDLDGSPYWQRPSHHANDDPRDWYAFPAFSEGYRRMMHWFAIDIWQFFADYNLAYDCNYEYIMRFDEDSFLHSPINYDVFNFMRSNDYNYGFRLCSYELQVTQRIWKLWRKAHPRPPPIRDIDLHMCGVYNNFFIAKLSFFQSSDVWTFLKFVDRQGMIYRRRLGDLMIHSMAVYAFSPPEKIHRFLDFTYEHSTFDVVSGCLIWGGIQAGYNDTNADKTINTFYKEKVAEKGCTANRTITFEGGLSPTYSHLPKEIRDGKLKLKSVMAGKVELLGKGILSG